VDIRENRETTCCLAMPVLDQKGTVVAAISASTSYERFSKEQDYILECVRKNAEEASSRMGYMGGYPAIKTRKSIKNMIKRGYSGKRH